MPKEDDKPKSPAKPEPVPRVRPVSKSAAEDKPKSGSRVEAKAIPTKMAVKSSDNGGETKGAATKTAAADMGGERNYRSLAIKVAAVVLILVVVVLVVFGVLIYGYKSENQAVKAVAQVVPYPVERVNGHFVSYNEYLFYLNEERRGYVNNAKLNNQSVDFNSENGKKLLVQMKQHVLDTTLKQNALFDQLAAQNHVKVTDKEINDLVSQLSQRYGGQTKLLQILNQVYGWNLADLKHVLRQQLEARDVEQKVTSNPKVDAAAKAKATDVLNKIKGGGDFTALAKQYSQASDASTGGDMGSFTKDQVPAEIWTAAQALQPGQVSDVIKDQYGYVILKVVDKSGDSVHAQEILIKTLDFNNYFQDQVKKAKTNTYIKV